ncbi:MAG: type II secretion system protein, partial [Desulfuromusa sp.]|nr:type II secretion system protein [Desulfuromusa sp.]
MTINYSRYVDKSGQRGFTFLELVVVITIISVLGFFALNRYYKLLVDVERTSMQHDLGVIRSAISMQVAGHYVAGNMIGLKKLVDSNPMDLLAETPNNYLGVI